MPYEAQGAEVLSSFAKGIDRDSPRTLIAEGHYDDALNMLLTSDTSGQHPTTMQPDAELDAAITWTASNVRWFAPFTYATYNSTTGVLTYVTELLIHRADGNYYTYTSGAPGTETAVRRTGSNATDLNTHCVYDQWLVLFNGRDNPLKYGQHFRWDGQNYATPHLFPLGSKPISPLVSGTVAGETWVSHTGGGSPGFIVDASLPVPARVGTSALRVGTSGTSTVDFDPVRDFRAGPRPYGGTQFATTDFIQFKYLKAATANQCVVRFYTAPGGGGTLIGAHTLSSITADGTWHQASIARAADTANWATVASMVITNDDATNVIYIDDIYFLYADAPPAAQVGCAHKDRIILGGVPVAGSNSDPALSTLFYSPASKPDEFPSTNTQVMSGGAQSLSRTNRITAVREYGDAVIVGMQNTVLAWTVGTDGTPTRSVVSTENGIDSPLALVETPSGSLLFPWQRGIYMLRQTGRNYVSEKVAPLLRDIWLEEPQWTVGIRDESTKTVRFWFREVDESDPTQTTNGIVFDYVRAQDIGDAVWPSRMGQLADYATEAYVDGVRETLYSVNDAADIWRMGAATSGAWLGTDTTAYIDLPWIGTQARDKVTKWIGISVPYKSTVAIQVHVRYANHPHAFDSASFEQRDSLAASPTIATLSNIIFGGTTKWVQVRLQAATYGFEIFPPISLIAAPTTRPG